MLYCCHPHFFFLPSSKTFMLEVAITHFNSRSRACGVATLILAIEIFPSLLSPPPPPPPLDSQVWLLLLLQFVTWRKLSLSSRSSGGGGSGSEKNPFHPINLARIRGEETAARGAAKASFSSAENEKLYFESIDEKVISSAIVQLPSFADNCSLFFEVLSKGYLLSRGTSSNPFSPP